MSAKHEPSDSVNGVPLLSICILSHNRGPQVDALLLYLKENLVDRYRREIEFIVVNNCSTDDTVARLRRHAEAGIRIVERMKLLPTAEENMMRSLEFCNGEYVWFLGDDDYPNTDAVDDLVGLLGERDVDLVVANTGAVSEIGGLLADQILDLRTPYVSVSMESLIASTGFLALLAGISRLIFRRTAVDCNNGLSFLETQAIYSHVFWLVSAFARKKTVVFNRPLVQYTTLCANRDLKRFRGIQEKNGVGRYHYWGIGLAKLVSRLLSEKTVSPDTLYRAFDLHNDGSRGRLLDFMVWHCYKQTLSAVKRLGGRESIDDADYFKFRNLVLSIDPSYFPLFRQLDRLYRHSREGGFLLIRVLRVYAASRIFLKAWSATTGGDRVHRILFRGTIGGFRIYRGPVKWIAIHGSTGLPVPADVFRLDIEVGANSLWLLADTRKEIESLINDRHANPRVVQASFRSDRPHFQEQGRAGEDEILQGFYDLSASIRSVARAIFEINESFRQTTFISRGLYAGVRRLRAVTAAVPRRIVTSVRGYMRI